MSYNVTISGKEYGGIEKVKLPITGENTYATFYATGIEEFLFDGITSFESDKAIGSAQGVYQVRPYAFYSSTLLERVSCPNAVYFPVSCFEGCTALKDVNLPSMTTVSASLFANCSALEEVEIPLVLAIAAKLFNNCTSLKKVDSSAAASIASSAFNNCSALEALILRNTTMATLANVNAFTGSAVASGTGYIYVPSSLIDSYKSATNWSTYSAQFRAIEDYPDICGQ